MQKIHNHLKTLRDMGVEVVNMRCSGKHYVLRCQSPQGSIFSTSISKSPSDYRSFLNWRASVRRVTGAAQ